jgi:DNA-binding MarR family transcriptional regulator
MRGIPPFWVGLKGNDALDRELPIRRGGWDDQSARRMVKSNSPFELDTPESSPPRSTVRVLNALRRITRAFRISATATQSTVGISAAQLYVLRRLRNRRSASITELANETLTDRTSVGAVVERLVEQDLARRSQAPDDRRRARVQITRKGSRLAAGAAAPTPLDLVVSALAGMSERETDALAISLEGLVAAMQIESTPAEMLYQELDQSQPTVRRRSGETAPQPVEKSSSRDGFRRRGMGR